MMVESKALIVRNELILIALAGLVLLGGLGLRRRG